MANEQAFAGHMQSTDGRVVERVAAVVGRARLERALGEHDSTLSDCPVNNPKRGKVLRRDDACPRCQAKASGSCGLASSEGWHLARAVRRILTEQPNTTGES